MISIHQLHCNTAIRSRDKNCGNKNVQFATRVPELNADVISFSGREKDLLELPRKRIFAKIDAAIADNKNFLGEGSEAKTYRIPDTPYCVRVVKKNNDNDSLVDYQNLLSFKIDKKDEINHIVAKLKNGSSIMKYIEGEGCFLSKRSKELFNLPVESYYNLYKQIRYAKDNDMVFDCCPGNIIYNHKDKSLTAIDFYVQDNEFPEDVRTLPAIFSAIAMSAENSDYRLYKNLLGKLIQVCLVQIQSDKCTPNDVANLDINALFRKFESYCEAGLPPQYELLKVKLVDIQCLKLKELLGEDVKLELDGNIKVVNALVKQILLKDDNSLLSKLKLWEVF